MDNLLLIHLETAQKYLNEAGSELGKAKPFGSDDLAIEKVIESIATQKKNLKDVEERIFSEKKDRIKSLVEIVLTICDQRPIRLRSDGDIAYFTIYSADSFAITDTEIGITYCGPVTIDEDLSKLARGFFHGGYGGYRTNRALNFFVDSLKNIISDYREKHLSETEGVNEEKNKLNSVLKTLDLDDICKKILS